MNRYIIFLNLLYYNYYSKCLIKSKEIFEMNMKSHLWTVSAKKIKVISDLSKREVKSSKLSLVSRFELLTREFLCSFSCIHVNERGGGGICNTSNHGTYVCVHEIFSQVFRNLAKNVRKSHHTHTVHFWGK